MTITADQVRQLREKTGAGMMECKKALTEAGGDFDNAIEALRKSGIANAEKRSGRVASEGQVGSYIHPGGRVGVIIEVNCETDFVARTPQFEELVRNLAMQVAAARPEFVRREDVPAERVAKERDILAAQLEGEKKPANIVEKIVEGRLNKFFAETCLLEQPYIKDDKRTVSELVKEASSRTGENVVVRRFSRFALGEE
jgi:elongation factor Ts